MYIELHLILHSWNCTQLTQYRVLRNRLFDKHLFSRNSVLGVCKRHGKFITCKPRGLCVYQFLCFFFNCLTVYRNGSYHINDLGNLHVNGFMNFPHVKTFITTSKD